MSIDASTLLADSTSEPLGNDPSAFHETGGVSTFTAAKLLDSACDSPSTRIDDEDEDDDAPPAGAPPADASIDATLLPPSSPPPHALNPSAAATANVAAATCTMRCFSPACCMVSPFF
ncbi:hypothetical protein ACRS3T_25095 [Burkholderia cenocepacia]